MGAASGQGIISQAASGAQSTPTPPPYRGQQPAYNPVMSQPTQASASWQNPTPFAPWTPRSVSTNANLYIFAINYNILRFISGMAGLAYV